ncbi:MAG: LytTR family transcriptional regulator, partial [Lachnospiraceae bacterium]|nr:LytTR family transcriptional regulator [Lachnospiraceae bacterium]
AYVYNRQLYMDADGRRKIISLAYVSEIISSRGIKAWAERCAGGAQKGTPEESACVGEPFLQCHRCCLVNLRHVREIRKTEIVMEQGMSVPVSRRMYEAVSRAFVRYYARAEEVDEE